jgi:hypothetical protein
MTNADAFGCRLGEGRWYIDGGLCHGLALAAVPFLFWLWYGDLRAALRMRTAAAILDHDVQALRLEGSVLEAEGGQDCPRGWGH